MVDIIIEVTKRVEEKTLLVAKQKEMNYLQDMLF